MFNAAELFKERLSAHVKELSRYGRYIFNGHLAILLLFLISALAVFYQQWLAGLSSSFPSEWIVIALFGLLTVYNPLQTLLKEADIVFLIAAEEKMRTYFRSTIVYNFVIQLYIVILAGAALGPLYFHAFPTRNGWVYIATIVLLIVFKAWNLAAKWWMYTIRDHSLRILDAFIRFLLSTSVIMFFVQEQMMYAAIVTIIYLGLFIYIYRLSHQNVGIPWDELIQKDHHRMNSFYRFANLFTDVPHLRNKLKQRKWIAPLVRKYIPYGRKHTFSYLFRLSFLRSGDYASMYIRLVIIGAILIILVPNMWLKGIFGLLFIYMSMFQLIPLYKHHRTMIWLDLYPVEVDDKRRAFQALISRVTWIQIVVFTLTFVGLQLFIVAGIFFISAIVFMYVFSFAYMRRKLT